MEDGFQRSGYGNRAVGFGARPAVLLVDFQRSFTDPEFPMGRSDHVSAAVDCSVRLSRAAKDAGAPVAACSVGWACDDERARWKVSSVYSDMSLGDRGLDLDPRLDGLVDYEFRKTAPSMFFGTPLVTWLTRQAIDTVLIGGATTSGCVRATINDAFSHGFRTIVVADCCGDQEADAHEANLRDVGRRYADIVSIDEACAALAETRI